MLSPSLEDYLEEIYRFSMTRDTVRVSDIGQKLGVTLPSVSKAMQRLRQEGYINYQRYGVIKVTDKGRQAGSYLVERNRLLQEFLGIIRANCDAAAEAEAMEHYLSPNTIQSFQRLMKFFQSDTLAYDRFLQFVTDNS